MNTFIVTFRDVVPRRAVPRIGIINESGFGGVCYDDKASSDISRCNITLFFSRCDGSTAPCASIVVVSAKTDRYSFCYFPFQQSQFFSARSKETATTAAALS
jgi:hypothetical protein